MGITLVSEKQSKKSQGIVIVVELAASFDQTIDVPSTVQHWNFLCDNCVLVGDQTRHGIS